MKSDSSTTVPVLDFQSSRSLLDQITEHYRRCLQTGEIPQGSRLPTCAELSRSVGIAPQTINRAFEALAREGLVYRRRSLGTIAGPAPTGGNSHSGPPTRRRKMAPVERREKLKADSPSVGLVMHSPDARDTELTFLLTDYLNGLIEGFGLCSFRFEIVYPEHGQSAKGLVSTLISSGKLDGLVHLHLDEQSTEVLLEHRFPFVSLNTNLSGKGIPSVVADHVQGYSEAWQYVQQLGHQRALHLGFQERNAVRRYECAAGRELAHATTALDYLSISGEDQRQAIHAAWTKQFGTRITAKWPTVVFTQTDLLAMQLIEVLQGLKISVPEQLSVIGFNNTSVAATFAPKVTTLAKPRRKMALAAAYLLSDLLEKRPGIQGRLQVFPLELIERETCTVPR